MKLGNLHMTYAGAAALLSVACSRGPDKDFLSSGVVESETVLITPTQAGRIVALYASEGDTVPAGKLLAVLDTVPLSLQLRVLQASRQELEANVASQGSQLRSSEADLGAQALEEKRVVDLSRQGVLPAQQEEKITATVASGRARLQAGRQQLASLQARRASLAAQEDLLLEQLRRCYLRAPLPGRVLTRYKNLEEAVSPGQPVFEIGREDTLRVDFFVPQPLLAGLRYGQEVRLRLDLGQGADFVPARVSWVSQEAEFSPKNIQTRESRNELVFRVRAQAANRDGKLKRGLPVEVWAGAAGG